MRAIESYGEGYALFGTASNGSIRGLLVSDTTDLSRRETCALSGKYGMLLYADSVLLSDLSLTITMTLVLVPTHALSFQGYYLQVYYIMADRDLQDGRECNSCQRFLPYQVCKSNSKGNRGRMYVRCGATNPTTIICSHFIFDREIVVVACLTPCAIQRHIPHRESTRSERV